MYLRCVCCIEGGGGGENECINFPKSKCLFTSPNRIAVVAVVAADATLFLDIHNCYWCVPIYILLIIRLIFSGPLFLHSMFSSVQQKTLNRLAISLAKIHFGFKFRKTGKTSLFIYLVTWNWKSFWCCDTHTLASNKAAVMANNENHESADRAHRAQQYTYNWWQHKIHIAGKIHTQRSRP